MAVMTMTYSRGRITNRKAVVIRPSETYKIAQKFLLSTPPLTPNRSLSIWAFLILLNSVI
jgi:hypothetical protein